MTHLFIHGVSLPSLSHHFHFFFCSFLFPRMPAALPPFSSLFGHSFSCMTPPFTHVGTGSVFFCFLGFSPVIRGSLSCEVASLFLFQSSRSGHLNHWAPPRGGSIPARIFALVGRTFSLYAAMPYLATPCLLLLCVPRLVLSLTPSDRLACNPIFPPRCVVLDLSFCF